MAQQVKDLINRRAAVYAENHHAPIGDREGGTTRTSYLGRYAEEVRCVSPHTQGMNEATFE